MNIRLSLVAIAFFAGALQASAADGADVDTHEQAALNSPIVAAVRQATAQFRNADAALAAGYINTGNCVSGKDAGAMGVHFVNPPLLFDDGSIDVATPEVLVYEPLPNGNLKLVAVEFISLDDGDPTTGSPVLMGQLLNYAGSPNRYGLPASHELHVWAWKRNPFGTFSDWNPLVTCEFYSGS